MNEALKSPAQRGKEIRSLFILTCSFCSHYIALTISTALNSDALKQLTAKGRSRSPSVCRDFRRQPAAVAVTLPSHRRRLSTPPSTAQPRLSYSAPAKARRNYAFAHWSRAANKIWRQIFRPFFTLSLNRSLLADWQRRWNGAYARAVSPTH